VGGKCTLGRAIVSANNDASPRGVCTPGRGADRIVLPRGSTQTLTTVNNTNYGPTGLPTIRSVITIAGNGSTIRHAGTAPKFRILAVAQTGALTLQNTRVSAGGPAVENSGSRLQLVNSTVSGNTSYGIGTRFGASTTVTNSTISGNSELGLYAFMSSEVRVINSSISGNKGGGAGAFNSAGDLFLPILR
jgi:parallel beta-helix repeat protein